MSFEALSSEDNGGLRHVCRIAFPMVLSTSSATVMGFVDRMFLSWHDPKEMAAALASGLTYWTLISLFIGTTSYTSTFVAQYFGSNEHRRIPAAVWQGVFFALASGLLMMLTGVFAGQLMGIAGHPEELHRLETTYYRILAFGAIGAVVSSALSGFYGGLGKTRIMMVVEIAGNVVNALLDYCMIFGKWGFPEWGIAGAAIATVISGFLIACTYVVLLFLGPLGRAYRVMTLPQLDRPLLWRLIRYGLPNGLGWTVDAAGWTGFVWLVGRLGEVPMQALSAAFAINHLAFFPMIGFSAATSIIVGQFIGAASPRLARRATYNAFAITTAWMTLIAAVFVLFPRELLSFFAPRQNPSSFADAASTAVVLLRFVALYSIFDSGNLIFSAALKGAGDTRFVFFMIVALSLVILIIPVYASVEILGLGVYASMSFATAYVIVLALAYYLRFLAGKWESMRVIETPLPPAQRHAEGPIVEP